MKVIKVKVKPNCNKNEILKKDDYYIVKLKEEAKNNKANIELIKVLSKYFKAPFSNIKIIKGNNLSIKLVKIK